MGGDTVVDALVEKAGLSHADALAVSRVPTTHVAADASLVSGAVQHALGTLVDEVRSSVDYYLASTAGQRLTRLVLTGGGSLLPDMSNRLSAAVRAPVVVGAPFAALDTSKAGLTPDQLRFVEPMASVPVGLALGGLR